jgi:GNAT superfamily N-acetyltransferase
MLGPVVLRTFSPARAWRRAVAYRLTQTLGVMKTRRATLADAESISALIHELSHHFLAQPSGPETEAFYASTSVAQLARYISEPDRVYVLAEDEHGLAGFIALKDASRISQFFVQPRCQGKGLGRRLWTDALLLVGAERDFEFTVDSSRAAVPVYESFGFRVCGLVTHSGGVVFIPMQRAVQPR